jgi:single-strand selective monofunctional uracil DNA glycosylase
MPRTRSTRSKTIAGGPAARPATRPGGRAGDRSPLIPIARRLARAVDQLEFGPPVTHVYDPLTYAAGPAEAYLERWGRVPAGRRRPVLLLGMNPGPWGMAQTGVPFGEIAAARDFLGLERPVGTPAHEHPRRPIEGFACGRSEVSGRRFWGFVAERFGTPAVFFRRFFVWNYCPLVFMEESGRNRTPEKLPAAEREPLFRHCDAALEQIIATLRPRWLIGVGGFAERRLRAVAEGRDPAELGLDAPPRIGTILHPSPASPLANRGWAPRVEQQFHELGIEIPQSA